MNNRDGMQALLDGKKIRHSSWRDDRHVYFNGEYLINEECLMVNTLPFVGEWEVYVEPKKKKIIEVKYYQRHYKSNKTNRFFFVSWDSDPVCRFLNDSAYKLLKTEERIETYEVDE